MIGIAMPAGDPVGGRHDVDPRFEDLHIEIFVGGEHAMEGQDIRLGGDDLLDAAGRGDSDRSDTRQLAGVAADLVRRVAVHPPNQFQVGLGLQALDHFRTDVPGGNLEYPNGCGHADVPFDWGYGVEVVLKRLAKPRKVITGGSVIELRRPSMPRRCRLCRRGGRTEEPIAESR